MSSCNCDGSEGQGKSVRENIMLVLGKQEEEGRCL